MDVKLCLILIISILTTKELCSASRILGVFPICAPSHYFLSSELLRGFSEAGHDVTFVTPFKAKDIPKNGSWREILIDDIIEQQLKAFGGVNLQTANQLSLFSLMSTFNAVGHVVTELTLNHTKVQNLIASNEKFDVVIIGQFLTDGLKALANHFDAHLVVFISNFGGSWIDSQVGNPGLPSFIPEFSQGLPSTKMTFFQRLQNTFAYIVFRLLLELFISNQQELVNKYIPHPPDLYATVHNVSLVLVNSHVSTNYVASKLPNMIEIGGFHLKKKIEKLPEDIQAFLDNAKNGVIYFSMGSNLKSKDFRNDTRDAILNAFAKRKEKVLWKWEDDDLPGKPPNLKTKKWLPQQEILAHPNVKVFITHGGFLSTTETVYHGVPTVAIPILGDQKMNAYSAQHAGYAFVLSYEELSEDTLTSALDRVIGNPKFRETAKEKSRILKDRLVQPMDEAIYWVEYIIRYNGAKHLRVAYLDLAWYQFFLLDVIGFILISVASGIWILKRLCSLICCKRNKKIKMKKN